MYSVYYDNKLIYSPLLVEDGYVIIEPVLTTEINKAGSFTFTMPPGSVEYGNIKQRKSVIEVFDGDDRIFRGRLLYEKRDINNLSYCFCEGELAELNDSLFLALIGSELTSADVFNTIIANHNAQVGSTYGKGFTVGTADNLGVWIGTLQKFSKNWDAVQQLLNIYGGYLVVRWNQGTRYIDYLQDYPSVSNNQVVEFGRNMLDLSQYLSAEEVFTTLLPYGRTASDILTPDLFIEDADATALFGKIVRAKQFTYISNDPTSLRIVGERALAAGAVANAALTINAVDLSLLGVDVNRLKVGTTSRIVSVPHGIDKDVLCTGATIYLQSPAQSSYTFGFGQKSLTDQLL